MKRRNEIEKERRREEKIQRQKEYEQKMKRLDEEEEIIQNELRSIEYKNNIFERSDRDLHKRSPSP